MFHYCGLVLLTGLANLEAQFYISYLHFNLYTYTPSRSTTAKSSLHFISHCFFFFLLATFIMSFYSFLLFSYVFVLYPSPTSFTFRYKTTHYFLFFCFTLLRWHHLRSTRLLSYCVHGNQMFLYIHCTLDLILSIEVNTKKCVLLQ